METFDWAEIGGVRLDGAPTEYPYRGLMLSRLPGWRGLPGARGSLDPVPGAHGAYSATEVLRDPRSMEIRGAAVGETAGVASQLLGDLESALAEKVVELRVSDTDGVWSRMVEVEAFTPAETWNRPRVTFTIDLIAPDPLRYRDPVTVGPLGRQKVVGGLRFPGRFPWSFGQMVGDTQLEVPNAGSVPMFPVLHIAGGFSGVTVTDRTTGRTVSFGAVARGETLTIDVKSRRASVNGRDESRRLVKRGWPVIQPESTGVFTAVYESPTGDPTLSVESCEGAW